MPIEIRELHIRVAVEPDRPNTSPAAASSTSAPAASAAARDALVAECVEQVLHILEAKQER